MPVIKPTDLWFQKTRALFNSMDVDGNGYLSNRDKYAMQKKFIPAKADPKKPLSISEKKFEEAMDDFWKFLEFKPKITYDDFLKDKLANLKIDAEDHDSLRLKRAGYFRMFFNLTDQKKQWTAEDMEKNLKVLVREKLSDDEAKKIFASFDKDGGGVVTFDEYSEACWTYEFSMDPSPYDGMFGPLPSLKDARPKGY